MGVQTSLLAASAAVLALGALDGLRRWWTGGRILARLGHRPRRHPAPILATRLLHDAGVDGDIRLYLQIWTAVLVLSSAASAVTAGGLVIFGVAAIGPPVALAALRGRGERLRVAQLPAALDIVAGSLRGGAALTIAIDDAAGVGGRLGPEFRAMARHSRDGMPLEDVVERWAQVDDVETALAAAALTMAASVGGPGADAVESAAASLRDRASASDEVAALSVQARLSAGVLTVAPVGFAVLLVSVDPTSARFLLATPAGWACISAGIALDVAGAFWMSRLVRRAT